MKTPHSITLIYGETAPQFNPETGEYETGAVDKKTVPCFINFPTQETIFEQYGSRDETIMIARFNQEQAPFKKAVYQGHTFKPIERIDAPIKGAVRLKEVVVDET